MLRLLLFLNLILFIFYFFFEGGGGGAGWGTFLTCPSHLPIATNLLSTRGSSLLPAPAECPKSYSHSGIGHPRRPRGSQSGRQKGRDESFQVRGKEPLGTDSNLIISKNSSQCPLLIGHKKCFVLLCPIGEQFLLSSFRECVHDGYCFDHGLSGSCTKEMPAVRKLSV